MIHKPNLSDLVPELCSIAVQAGKAVMNVYEKEDFHVRIKEDQSPLTEADQLSNQIIVEGLNKLDVNFPIITEENKEVPYAVRKKYSYYWLVDPLDGTKEFIKRNGDFTVNIALVHCKIPVIGVVFVPVNDELFWGVQEQGSFRILDGKAKRLQVIDFCMDDPRLIVVCSRSHLSSSTKKYMDSLVDPQTISRGSSLKFLEIAKGNAHLYPRLGPTMEWDTAAAHVILVEAGGKVINQEYEKELEYNKKSMLNPYFVASGRIIRK